MGYYILKSYTFSDFDSQLQITNSGNVKVVYDKDVILQSIKHIMATVSGERVRSSFGGSLVGLLFQPMDEDLVFEIRRILTDAILKFEPRVGITQLSVYPNYDGNYYDIRFDLFIKDINEVLQYDAKLRAFN